MTEHVTDHVHDMPMSGRRMLWVVPIQPIWVCSVRHHDRTEVTPWARSVTDEEFAAYVAASRPALWRTAYLLCGNVPRPTTWSKARCSSCTSRGPGWSRGDRLDGYARRIIVNSHIDEMRRPWRRETETLEGHEPVTR